MPATFLVRVTDKDLQATAWLDSRGEWHPGDNSSESKRLTQMLTEDFKRHLAYDYSPADGHPGYRFAHGWAKSHECVVETNPPPPLPEGAIP